VKKDLKQAAQWYTRAAEAGFSRAQYNIAAMYETGDGVPQDYVKAAEWYQKAAEQGHGLSQNYLGTLYHQGKGVPQDFVKAYMWYNLAATKLQPGKHQDMALKNQTNVTQLMKPAQVTEAQNLAGEWQVKQ